MFQRVDDIPSRDLSRVEIYPEERSREGEIYIQTTKETADDRAVSHTTTNSMAHGVDSYSGPGGEASCLSGIYELATIAGLGSLNDGGQPSCSRVYVLVGVGIGYITNQLLPLTEQGQYSLLSPVRRSRDLHIILHTS